MPHGPLITVPAAAWWCAFLAVAGFAVAMTGVAYLGELPRVFQLEGVDKVVHFCVAGMLAFFLDGALKRRKFNRLRSPAIPWAAVVVLTPVGVEEFLQRYAIARTSSGWDFAADVAGVTLLIPLSRRLAK